MSGSIGEMINVEKAAEDYGLGQREVWTIIREQSVPVVRGPRARMSTAKFRRSDWEAGLERSLQPVEAPKSIEEQRAGTGHPLLPVTAGSKSRLSRWRDEPQRKTS